MSLKYYEARDAIRKSTPTASYKEDYAAILDFSFDNAPNVVYDEIEYEETYGQNDFKFINRVRVDTILKYNTGIILGDDYKTFVFDSEFPVEPYYGMKFRWKGSYWLVINTNKYASIVTTAEVRRCNNVLRFFDDKGQKVYEPCIVDYTLRFANNEDTMTIVVGNGEQKVWCQRNERTTLIKPNERFLFGTPEQRVAFRLYAGGTKNYLNSITEDDNSPTITEFYADHYEINPLFDDLENGFADAYLNEVSIKFDKNLEELSVSQREKIELSVFKGKNKIQVDNVILTSSDSSILSIDGDIAIANSVGEATITAQIEDTNITADMVVNVLDEPIEDKYELIVSPDVGYVLQNKTQKFTVYLYKNGIQQEDVVSFSDLSTKIPTGKYIINDITDNSFSLTNKGMYMDNPVVIRCVCGDYSIDINIKLRGLY